MSRIAIVQASFPDTDMAERIAAQLVEEGLAACANVLPGCRSVYRWQGMVERADEAIAQFKTRAALAGRLSTRLAALHPYDLPAIEHWEAEVGAAVMAWVEAETA